MRFRKGTEKPDGQYWDPLIQEAAGIKVNIIVQVPKLMSTHPNKRTRSGLMAQHNFSEAR